MKKILITLFAVVLANPASSAMAQQKTGDTKAATVSEPMAAMPATHSARGTVKKLDVAAGVVVLAHGPVKSLNWPSMTMGFKVGDKTLFDKLAVGKAVDFEFMQTDKGYVVTGVK